jgi:hypothetical protein
MPGSPIAEIGGSTAMARDLLAEWAEAQQLSVVDERHVFSDGIEARERDWARERDLVRVGDEYVAEVLGETSKYEHAWLDHASAYAGRDGAMVVLVQPRLADFPLEEIVPVVRDALAYGAARGLEVAFDETFHSPGCVGITFSRAAGGPVSVGSAGGDRLALMESEKPAARDPIYARLIKCPPRRCRGAGSWRAPVRPRTRSARGLSARRRKHSTTRQRIETQIRGARGSATTSRSPRNAEPAGSPADRPDRGRREP